MNIGNPEELSILQINNLVRNKSIKKVNMKFSNELYDETLRRKTTTYLSQ